VLCWGISCIALRGLLDTDVYRVCLSQLSLGSLSGSGQGRHVSVASLASHLGNHKDCYVVRKRRRSPVYGKLDGGWRACELDCPVCLFRRGQVSSEPACDEDEVI